MADWYDTVKKKFVANVANRYMADVGLAVFNIFPLIPTTQMNGTIAKYTKEDWLYIGNPADYLVQGSMESKGDDFSVGSQDYLVKQYKFHKDVSEDEANEYDNPFDPVADATRFAMNRINRVTLQLLVNTYLATSVWGTDLQGGTDFTKWSDPSATPVADVLAWKLAMAKVTGYSANRLVLSADVYNTLLTHPDITGKMKVTSDQIVDQQLLARLFRVDSLNVISDVNSEATDFMATKLAWLGYTPDNPSRYEPSAGYVLVRKLGGAAAAPGTPNFVETRRIPMPLRNNGLRIECGVRLDMVAIATDLGTFAYDVI